MNDRALSLIGIARRANAVAIGRTAARRWLKRGKLLILAEDLSERVKNDWRKVAHDFRIDVIERWTMRELGDALGRPKPVGIVLITDPGLAREIKRLSG
ncbi:MAG: hypothetical protein DRQ10_06105 [Candidatus Hydrothermota bacterium]|nr:MAG: hypothetical protein DRQ10_06105 [Candidatus Hydrothermae bacterium]